MMSPGFIFSVAIMYRSVSPCPTMAILAVRWPSNMTSITLSSCGGPSVGPSRSYFTQWNLCFTPPPIPFATYKSDLQLNPLRYSCMPLVQNKSTHHTSRHWITTSQMCHFQWFYRIFLVLGIVHQAKHPQKRKQMLRTLLFCAHNL